MPTDVALKPRKYGAQYYYYVAYKLVEEARAAQQKANEAIKK